VSRFSSEDYDEMFPNQGQLWWANVERAVKGRHGQRDLRTLEAALEALPEKRLIQGRLVSRKGEVCAVAALVAHRRAEKGESRDAVLAEMGSLVTVYCDHCQHTEAEHDPDGSCRSCAENVARAALEPERRWTPRLCSGFVESEESDDYGDVTASVGKKAGMTYSLAWRIGYLNDEDFAGLTPEQRYERVLAWVREQLVEPVAA